jgi:drug/metabolite transporter (DMT)-like permease
VLASLEVLVTLVLAMGLLGERLTPPQWAGAALILGAVAFQNTPAMRRAVTGAVTGTRGAAAPPEHDV